MKRPVGTLNWASIVNQDNDFLLLSSTPLLYVRVNQSMILKLLCYSLHISNSSASYRAIQISKKFTRWWPSTSNLCCIVWWYAYCFYVRTNLILIHLFFITLDARSIGKDKILFLYSFSWKKDGHQISPSLQVIDSNLFENRLYVKLDRILWLFCMSILDYSKRWRIFFDACV